ncbi:MAG: aminotransferase class I/II-fold pyridoxal phosphate-dependent enzyme, partial [Verrucomicrobiota bacterium]
TAPPPALAHATAESIRLIRSKLGDERRAALWANVNALDTALNHDQPSQSAIIPHIVGDSRLALELSRQLLDEHGLLVPAIRFPTVPRNSARLRITLSALHQADHIEALTSALD